MGPWWLPYIIQITFVCLWAEWHHILYHVHQATIFIFQCKGLYQVQYLQNKIWFIWQNDSLQKFLQHITKLLFSSLAMSVEFPTPFIKYKLHKFMWNHFIEQFDDSNVHSFHYLCPCCHCSTTAQPTMFTELT